MIPRKEIFTVLPHHSAHEISSHPRALSRAVQKALLNMALAALPMQHAFAQDSGTAAPAEEAVLPAVTATAQRTTTTEGSQSYGARAASSSTGLTLAPRDTPQAITVITRQQLDDMNIQTMDQLLNITPGVSSTQTDIGARSTYRARGFDITTYRVDGIEFNGGASFAGIGSGINMDLYDHVEVVRGANGLMGGAGDPSATINLARKRPGTERKISGGVRLESWGSKHADVDVNLPMTDDARVRSRFVISTDDGDTFRDREKVKSLGVLGLIDADLTSDATVTAGVQHEKNRTDGASWGTSVPIWYANGARTNLPRSFNPAANWSYTERESTTVFANLEQRLANRWKANLALSHTKSEATNNFGVVKVNNQGTTWGGFLNPDGTGGRLNAIHSESEAERTGISASINGPFTLFGREHEFMAGINGTHTEETTYTFNATNCSVGSVATSNCQYRLNLPVSNIYTWDGNYTPLTTFRTNARTEAATDNIGLYTAARFNLSDSFKSIIGVRLSKYKTYTDTFTALNVSSRNQVMSKDVITPYVGLMYDINKNYSLYASYTNLFNPQSRRDVNGDYLKPITGSSYEAGVKGELLEGALNVSAAVFQAKQNNVGVLDGNVTPDGAASYVASTSGVESKGLELEASGMLTKNWTALASYAYVTVDNASALDRDPKHVVRLQTSYKFSGGWNKLTVGGGASWQSGSVWSVFPGQPGSANFGSTTAEKTSGYALFNVMARYQINKNLVATFNVSNLFDKTYYRQYGFYDGLIYGEPRRISLGLRASF